MRQHKISDRWIRFLSLIEIAPLILFIVSRTYGLDMTNRILIGGGVAILVFAFYALRSIIKFTPLYFGTNLFFVITSIVLVLPFPTMHTFLLDLREVGMFLAILIVGFVWQNLSPTGLFPTAQVRPESKKYSWVLLGIYALCPAIAHYFKGDENLAGALPFGIIIVADQLLYYFQSRETRGRVDYVK